MSSSMIDGMSFTLYYSYDQVRDRNLSRLTDDGKVEWFRLRMELVFLEPLRRIIDSKSVAHKELNSSTIDDNPRRTAVIAAFSLLLNGIESLGSFLNPISLSRKDRNRNNFREFIHNYMPAWDITPSAKIDFPTILWKHYRNGIAHGFVIEGGHGIDYAISPRPWEIQQGKLLQINPEVFFADFLEGTSNFFCDIRDPKQPKRTLFLTRFKDVYPH